MINTLIISQTVFYIIASLAIVIVAVLLVVVIYYLICILRNTRSISDDISETYNKTKKNIHNIINSLKGNKKNYGKENKQ